MRSLEVASTTSAALVITIGGLLKDDIVLLASAECLFAGTLCRLLRTELLEGNNAGHAVLLGWTARIWAGTALTLGVLILPFLLGDIAQAVFHPARTGTPDFGGIAAFGVMTAGLVGARMVIEADVPSSGIDGMVVGYLLPGLVAPGIVASAWSIGMINLEVPVAISLLSALLFNLLRQFLVEVRGP